MSKSNRSDVFSRVTATIVESLERGVKPWIKPWTASGTVSRSSGLHHNAQSRRAYTGLNQIVLMCAAIERGYSSTSWMTPRAAMELGLDFKGEKTCEVVFWKKTERKSKDDAGNEKTERGMFAKSYRLLNLDQCKGDKSSLVDNVTTPAAPVTRHEMVEKLEAALGLRIVHGGAKACYVPSFDQIHMPEFDTFKTEPGYLATLLHECVHSTGAKHRLEREFGARFADSLYAAEELVAELGSAMLCASLNIDGDVEQHASYIESWIKMLQNDDRAILTAASKASAAANYVLDALGQGDVEDVEDTEEETAVLAAAA